MVYEGDGILCTGCDKLENVTGKFPYFTTTTPKDLEPSTYNTNSIHKDLDEWQVVSFPDEETILNNHMPTKDEYHHFRRNKLR